MMDTTFNVRIYKTDVWVNKHKDGKTTYWVRWRVDKEKFKLPYATSGLAESFRSQLVTAAAEGKAFRLDDGLPVNMARATKTMGWYDLACGFTDMKWTRSAATTRRTHAEALTAATVAMLTDQRGKPDAKLIRHALCRWEFNTNKRDDPTMPADVANALRWAREHCREVSALNEPDVLRSVLDRLITKLDGKPYAPSVSSRRRKIFGTLIGYAVEKELLDHNPVPELQWTRRKLHMSLTGVVYQIRHKLAVCSTQ